MIKYIKKISPEKIVKRFEYFVKRKSKTEAFLTFLSFIGLRFFFETLLESAHAVENKFDFILHFYLFFIALFILIYIYLRFFFEKEFIFKLICYGFFIIILPPFVDFILSGGKGFVLSYLTKTSQIPTIYFSLFTSPFTVTFGATPGIKIEVLIIDFLLSIYLFFRLSGIKKKIIPILNFFIFPFFPLLLSSIFAIEELYYYSLVTPIFIAKPTIPNLFFIIIILVLSFFAFKEYFPEKVNIFSFIFPFITLLVIVLYSIKISEFVPRFLFLPGNILYIILQTLSVFFLYISFNREKLYILPLVLSFLLISIQSSATIVAFFVFSLCFYVYRNYPFLYNFLFLTYSLIIGLTFFALGSKIPFPDFKNHIFRLSADFYKKEKKYSKAINLLSKISKKEFYDYFKLSELSFLNGDFMDFDIFLEISQIKYISAPPHYRSIDNRVDFWKLEKERFLKEKDYSLLYMTALSVLNPRVESENILKFLYELSDNIEEREKLKLKKFLAIYGYKKFSTYP
ncbi:MAG: hypothetical protein ABIN15_04210 [candidate division WOR-3 bacterium]